MQRVKWDTPVWFYNLIVFHFRLVCFVVDNGCTSSFSLKSKVLFLLLLKKRNSKKGTKVVESILSFEASCVTRQGIVIFFRYFLIFTARCWLENVSIAFRIFSVETENLKIPTWNENKLDFEQTGNSPLTRFARIWNECVFVYLSVNGMAIFRFHGLGLRG